MFPFPLEERNNMSNIHELIHVLESTKEQIDKLLKWGHLLTDEEIAKKEKTIRDYLFQIEMYRKEALCFWSLDELEAGMKNFISMRDNIARQQDLNFQEAMLNRYEAMRLEHSRRESTTKWTPDLF